MNAKKYSIGVLNVIDPRYSVPIQLNTLIAEKIATNIDIAPKIAASNCEIPATNRWWPQVRNPMNAMPSDDMVSALYEIGCFFENVGTTSLITPIAGRIMM